MAYRGPAATPLIAAVLVLGVLLTSPALADASKDIGATGTIEPRGGVVTIGGVQGARITSIRAKVGESVKQGDVLMTLDDRQPRLDANLAEIALQESRRHAAQADADEAVSLQLAQDRDQRAEQQLTAYRALGPNATSLQQTATLEAAAEEAHDGVAIERRKSAQVHADGAADVMSATKRYDAAKAKLSDYTITAPASGVILQVTQHVGETLSGAPAISMGDISSMYVTCDAFQGDLLKIATGMRATVTSNAFSQILTGQVEWVGRLIQTKSQTGQFRVKLDDSNLASRLVGMEVNVKVAR